MTNLYIRWGGVCIVAIVLIVLTYTHYRDNLASLVPQQVRQEAPKGDIRVLGMVQGGTLETRGAGEATFALLGENASLPVHYQGPPPDNLRELKILVLIGTWNAGTQVFEARDIGIVPNYGFIAGAYLLGLLPLALLLFAMSRRVHFLYDEIKASKLYEEE
ncbi:MAG: cytochrome c maturation protein CcmE [Nitrospira sp. SB0666_bin_27]|nr:cytochrome c maturation protein CcmE [Nitrospira sp. SB0666_bin_27]MYF24181.1 cytochrome c maturation protein CcmE [Nitrospira sp. SB0678_bin_10]